ncbi:MAG TPA: tetratricopeptide repeat protein [Stellaceae bacterium]|nr:tetratricopeptide repeat protein [Stellaceae bacterium]
MAAALGWATLLAVPMAWADGLGAEGKAGGGKGDLAAAQAADQRHDSAAAIPLYTSALASGTLSPDAQSAALHARALDERDQRHFDRAIADDTEAIKLKPDDEQAFVDRATTYAYSANIDAAIDDLNTAIGLKPTDITALIDRGAIYAAQHDYGHALTDLNAAVEAQPDNLGAILNRAAAYHGAGDNDKAIADLDTVIKQWPALAGAYYDRGNAWRDKNNLQRALADYSTAIRLKPDYADAYNNRGNAYQLAGQYPRALADFAVAIRIAPNEPSAYYNRAKVYRDLGQYDDAIADYDSLLYLTPNFPGGYNGRAYANFAAGRFAATANDLKRSLSLDGKQQYPILWLHLVRLRQRQIDSDEFAANLGAFDTHAWPQPVAAFLAHRLSGAELLMATQLGDARTRVNRVCDANFFLGEDAIAVGQKTNARRYFQAARKACPISSPSYTGTVAELRRR